MGALRLLITGSNGLLGQKMVALCRVHRMDFAAISSGPNRNPDCPDSNYTELDITQEQEVMTYFDFQDFTHIVHTAAMTNVDACELNPALCNEINLLASKRLFEIAQKKGCHFTLLSTDFVFDGHQGNYRETDTPNPLSVYGKSKWMAEQELKQSAYSKWAIARTIIVYGKGHQLNKSNIFSWLIQELTQGKEVSLITDHFRAPTWVEDLAEGCLSIVLRDATGIFHLSGPETLSIHEIGLRVARYLGVSEQLILPIDSKTLNQPASRPALTGFNLEKSSAMLGYKPHSIEETLEYL
jgi:dTDP-4-dehydrorhamnose reductase